MPHFLLGWANGRLNKDRKGFTYTFKDDRERSLAQKKKLYDQEHEDRKA
jgi:hypothetical protein